MNIDFSRQRNIVIITTGRKKEWINVGDILYITVDLTLSSVFVLQRDAPYFFVKQLTRFEKELGDYGFFRANGNTLVNGNYVKRIEKEQNNYFIYLHKDKKISLSRRQYSKIRKIIKR